LWGEDSRGLETMKEKIKRLKRRLKIKHTVVIVILILFVIIFTYKTANNNLEEKIIREAVVAGSWYPGDKKMLTETLTNYFNNAKKSDFEGDIKALVVPHAGYVFSGQVAAQGFNQIEKNYKKVIIIGTNHAQGVYVPGISVPTETHYRTPLGEVKVSKITKELLKKDLFVSVPDAHRTHVIEIELPFLQQKLENFEIIPLITGMLDSNQIQEAVDILSSYIDEDTLIVVSSDLSHYHDYDEAVKLDTNCISNMESLNFEEASKCEACGLYALLILIELAKKNNWGAEIIDYKNSGDTSGDKSRVVGYSSIVFYEKNKGSELTEGEKETILNIARKTLESIYNGEEVSIASYEITPNLKKVQGCFTTLNKNGNLRGCIGHILPQEELYKCVIDNIINAALHDSRFNPVTNDELKDIEIEISVLSVPERLSFKSGEDLKDKLRPNIDGVVLKKGWHQSTYLPQVWEQLPDKELFLSNLCIKGGMTLDCWKDTKTEVYTYQAYVFSESEQFH
jgi:AmmeMemoRadiSam system protein B/AmmeMemoRadiSam system protein A